MFFSLRTCAWTRCAHVHVLAVHMCMYSLHTCACTRCTHVHALTAHMCMHPHTCAWTSFTHVHALSAHMCCTFNVYMCYLWMCFSLPDADLLKAGASPRLLDWESIQHKLPWNVIILLGSGFAIAEAAAVSAMPSYCCYTAHTNCIHHYIIIMSSSCTQDVVHMCVLPLSS